MPQANARWVRSEDAEIAAGIDARGDDLARAERGDGGVHGGSFGDAAEVNGQRTSEAHPLATLQNNVAPVAMRATAKLRGQQSPTREERRDGEIERAFGSAGDVEPTLQDREGFVADFDGAEECFGVDAGEFAVRVVGAHRGLNTFNRRKGPVNGDREVPIPIRCAE